MKRRHRIPPVAHFISDPITAEYQAEVDRTMDRTATREAAALRRLESAQHRLAKAEHVKPKARRDRAVQVGRELVEIRRQELLAVQRMANAAPSSAVHRGKGHGVQPRPGMSTL